MEPKQYSKQEAKRLMKQYGLKWTWDSTLGEGDIQCFCGFDLNTGMKVVCCFVLYIIAFHFLEIILRSSYITYFIGTFLCSGYLIILFNIFQTLEELSYDKSAFNYRFFF